MEGPKNVQNAVVAVEPLNGYEDFEAVLASVRCSLAPFGGIRCCVKPGAKVLLKVNLVAPSRPELAVTTHPAILRAAIRLVKEAGGICFVGDGPGVGDTRTAASASGLLQVIEEENASLAIFEETALYENQDNRVLKQIPLTAHLAQMDVVISLPKLKTHCQMAFTGALKNQYGLIPGSAKGKYHFRFQNREKLADLMIDINRTAQPALAIMDAVIGMEGPGPSGGTPRKIGVVISGTDLAAVDTIAFSIIGLKLEQVPVSLAAKRGNYGTPDLENIQVIGTPWENVKISDFHLVKAPVNIMRILPLPNGLLKWIRRQVAPAPRIDESKCIRCRRCERGCPVEPPAITPLASGRKINDATCIRCYCCHEFCPVKAIDLKKSLLARLLDLEKVATLGSHVVGRVASWFRR